MEKSNSFTEGKILRPLLTFTLPILFAMFLQVMYGAVDLFIVGKFAQAADVSAVSTGSQIMHTMTMVIMSLSMGTTILLGQRIGARENSAAGAIIGASIVLFAFLSISVTFIMVLEAESIAGLMHAPPEAFAKTVEYVRICSLGTVFIIAYNLLGSIFRGIGNSKLPLMIVTIACVCNILGDLLLIAGLELNTIGAAIATVAAQAISVLISLLIIKKMPLPFTFSLSSIRFNKALIMSILKMGLPLALQDFLVSISFLVVLAIVNSLGVIVSAGVGVAEKLIGFVMLVPGSFAQAISAFVAQNIGARKYLRAKKALFYGIISSLSAGVVMFYVAFFHGDILASFFVSQADIILATTQYLRAFAIDCLLTAFMFCFIGYFNGCGQTSFVMLQGILSAFAVRIPFAYVMSQLQPVSVFHIGLATPASTFVQILMCVAFFIKINKKAAQ